MSTNHIIKKLENLCLRTSVTQGIQREMRSLGADLSSACQKQVQDLKSCYQLQKLNIVFFENWMSVLVQFLLSVCDKRIYILKKIETV